MRGANSYRNQRKSRIGICLWYVYIYIYMKTYMYIHTVGNSDVENKSASLDFRIGFVLLLGCCLTTSCIQAIAAQNKFERIKRQ